MRKERIAEDTGTNGLKFGGSGGRLGARGSRRTRRDDGAVAGRWDSAALGGRGASVAALDGKRLCEQRD